LTTDGFFCVFTLNIQNSNNQTTTATWQAFSYLFNEFLHFCFESGKEEGWGGGIFLER
jgi:hypothetical protein